MKQQKFIITRNGYLRLGLVVLHRDLLRQDDHCIGGGFYEIDCIGNRLLFEGESMEFGKPRWYCIDVLKVPKAYRGMRFVYCTKEKYTGDILLNEVFGIEYYK